MATNSPPEKAQKLQEGQKPELKKEAALTSRDTSGSDNQDARAPVLEGWSETSAVGSAVRNLAVEMAESPTISVTAPCYIPENQHCDLQGSSGPSSDLGHLGPKMDSHTEVGQPLKDSGLPSGCPTEIESSESNRRKKKPKYNQGIEFPEGLLLPEAEASEPVLQLPSSLRSQPSKSRHVELLGWSHTSPRLVFSTAAMPDHVPAPYSDECRQDALPIPGLPTSAPETSPDVGGPATSAGRDIWRAATPPASGLGLCSSSLETSPDFRGPVISGNWNLRPRATPQDSGLPSCELGSSQYLQDCSTRAGRGLHPCATRPNPDLCSSAPGSSLDPSDRDRRTYSWDLRPRATQQKPGLHSTSPGSGFDLRGRARHTYAWDLRPRANPRIPHLGSQATQAGPDPCSSASDPGSGQHSASALGRHSLGPNPTLCTTGSPPSLVLKSRPTKRRLAHHLPGPALGNPSTSNAAFPRRLFPRTSSSTESEAGSLPSQAVHHAVRMRASSPSPPGRFFPLAGQCGEKSSSSSSSSPSSSPSSSVSPSPSSQGPNTFYSPSSPSGQSSPSSSKVFGLSSISTPSPTSLWRALMPDLDDLNSSSPKEEKEVGDAPHSPTQPVL